MRASFARISITVVAACGLAAAIALPAAAAKAKTSYTVKVGTTTSGKASLASKAGQAGFGFFSLADDETSPGCTASTSTLSVALSGDAAAKKIFKIGPTTFSGCHSYDGTALTLTTKGTWQVNAVGPTSSSGVTPLLVSKVKIAVVAPNGACSFDLTGSVDLAYTNSGGLALGFATGSNTHDLVVSDFTGTPGNYCDAANGDQVVPNALETVTATSPTGAFSITSN
jgi:hypothetical protein